MKPSNGEHLYTLTGICKTYKRSRFSRPEETDVRALRNVDLTIQRGEFLCVVGPSGEGKSTLLHLLGALDEPTSGQLLFEGKPLRQYGLVSFRRNRVGFVFQMFYLFPYKSAVDNVAVALTLQGVTRQKAREEAAYWLEVLGLKEDMHRRPSKLSGGQQQRVAIARAVVKKPDVILADEPTGNLDKASRGLVLDSLRRMNEEHGITVVMVTHNQPDAEMYGDRVALVDGRTVDKIWTTDRGNKGDTANARENEE